MIYRVLGDLEVGLEGQLLALPGGHRLVVLGVLLLCANRRVSHQDLIRTAWGDQDVEEGQLHKGVWAIRKLLEKIDRRDDLVTRPGSYELRVADHDLDSLMFQRLVRQADEAGRQHAADDEIDLLRQALQLWRGHRPLANLLGDTVHAEADALVQRRRRAAVRLFDLLLTQGDYDRALTLLTGIADHHPTDRRLRAQLMVALYRTGDTEGALAAYQDHASRLDLETGAAPEAQIRALYYAIGNNDGDAVGKIETELFPKRPRQVRQTIGIPKQLPSSPMDFVGRQNVTLEAVWLLAPTQQSTVSALVISGQGGIGKTALALHVAHQVREQYPDGQLFVELAGNTGKPLATTEALAQILRAFGVGSVPETQPERRAQYRTMLADRRVLLLLDDAYDEEQIRDLIPANRSCGVLVTARQRLPDIDGSHHIPMLEPLDAVAATELFSRIIARGGVDRSAEPEATEHVITLCAGLPLALCVAAAQRVRDFDEPTAQLAARLASQGSDAFKYGERSLTRTIGAGFDRLDRDTQRLFLGLGSLALPEFGLWAASAALPNSETDPARALSRLASGGLVQSSAKAQTFKFHDLARGYARSRAEREWTRLERTAMAQAVYGALLTLARHAHRALYKGDYEVVHCAIADRAVPNELMAEVARAPLDWFESARLNLRAAVTHCAELGLVELCWDLAVSAHEFYSVGRYFDDWYATHTTALVACREANDRRGEGIVLAILGQPELVAGRRHGGAASVSDLERSVELLAACGDQHAHAIAARTLANALRRQGELTRPLALFREALAGYSASGDRVGHCQTLRFIGQTQLEQGAATDALRTLGAALTEAQEMAEPRLIAQSSYWLGRAQLDTGDLADARVSFQTMLDIHGSGSKITRAYAKHGLGDAARLAKNFPEAQRQLESAAEVARDAQDARLEGRVWLSIAALRQAQLLPDDQIDALRRAATCFNECDAQSLAAETLSELRRVAGVEKHTEPATKPEPEPENDPRV